MNDTTFHVISLILESGLVLSVLNVIWKASAVMQEFQGLKKQLTEHIAEDKSQQAGFQAALIELIKGQARIEGHYNGVAK